MTSVDLAAVRWRKSSYSGGGSEGNCVEIAHLPTAVALRDSKAPHAGALVVSPPAWQRFRITVPTL